MPLNCHLPGHCSTWNMIVSHRRSPDFSTQPNCCHRTAVNLSPRKSTRAWNVSEGPVRIVLPFKDQRSTSSVRRQLGERSFKIGTDIRPVYASRKIGHEIKPKKQKPPIINQQRVVYCYKYELCDANCVGNKLRHLYQRVEDHKESSSIGNTSKINMNSPKWHVLWF